jgi:hypothetical protein
MKKFLGLLFVFILIFTGCQKSGSSDKFKIDPEPIIQDALKNKKFLILVFESADCRYCEKLNREVLSQPDFKEKQIKNRYHNTVDNITDKVITLLPDNVNIDIETIRETIKISKELQEFKKEELKPLKTMLDVAKYQLRKTRFETGMLQKSSKVKKLNKEEKEEIRENVRSQTKSGVKTSNANKVAKRYLKQSIGDSKETRGVYFRDSSKFKDFDRDIVTERGRGVAKRRWRFKFKRFNVDTNRSNRRVNQSIKITRAEIRSDTKRLQNSNSKTQGYER